MHKVYIQDQLLEFLNSAILDKISGIPETIDKKFLLSYHFWSQFCTRYLYKSCFTSNFWLRMTTALTGHPLELKDHWNLKNLKAQWRTNNYVSTIFLMPGKNCTRRLMPNVTPWVFHINIGPSCLPRNLNFSLFYYMMFCLIILLNKESSQATKMYHPTVCSFLKMTLYQ